MEVIWEAAYPFLPKNICLLMGVISQRKEVTIQEGRSRSRKCRGNPGTGPLQLLVHCILQCPSVTWLYAPVFDQNMSQKFVKSLLSVTARPVI